MASTERLQALGIPVFDANELQSLSVYIDGADEIDGNGNMIKGGGAALTREKSWLPWRSGLFVSQTSPSAWEALGKFPLPVEVIPWPHSTLPAALKPWAEWPRCG